MIIENRWWKVWKMLLGSFFIDWILQAQAVFMEALVTDVTF